MPDEKLIESRFWDQVTPTGFCWEWDGRKQKKTGHERDSTTSDDDLRAEFDRALAAHDAEVLAAERERIIQDMQERSHPDDWGVPCVYVKSYAERLRGEKR